MKRIITALALAVSFCATANAQIDIAGIPVYSHPTKAQIEAKFGKPSSYEADKSYYYYDDTPEAKKTPGIYETYKYPGMELGISTDWGLDFVKIFSKEYPIMTGKVSAAGVRVGQKASILNEKYHMKGEKRKLYSTEYSRKIGADWYRYSFIGDQSDDGLGVLIKDGIIYGFMFNAVTL